MATKPGNATSVTMAFFADLVRCETRLYNQFNDELRAAHGIVTSQYEFLRYLRDHDRPRTADVAAEFAAGVGAMSKAADRLEARGWLTRIPNPDDRRSTILALTEEGRTLLAAADTTFQTRLRELLTAAASNEQLAAAGAVLSALRGTLESNGLGTPVG